MGGKTAQSSSQVQIPPDVLARYNSVNATAQTAASQPFQQYSTDPNSFVAPVNPQQTSGINTINNSSGSYQPYFDAATSALGAGNAAGISGTNAAYAPLNTGLAAANNYQGTAANYFNAAQNGAAPYNAAAGSLFTASAAPVDPSSLDSASINKYLNPYLNTVLQGTIAPMEQQFGQQQSALQGNQIMNGTFGGDRSGIDRAVLQGQQGLALGQTAAGILQPAYETALQTAAGQQGIGLSAAQANRSAFSQAASGLGALGQQVYGQGATTGQNYAGLGQQVYGQGQQTSSTMAGLAQQLYGMGLSSAQINAMLGQGVQGAGLAAGQAQIGAGTVQQQTQQAGLSALYNQFQQQQGYPFQVAQFLANIAEGTGSLSGSTTVNTQPVSSFLSDERAKDDIEPIGKTFDGQNIVKFRYKGDPRKQIGLIAQDVERHHPDAVGLAGNLKTVDYDAATKDAAARGHFADGGMPGYDLGSIIQAQGGMYAPLMQRGAGYAAGLGGAGGGGGYHLATSKAPELKPMTLHDVSQGAGDAASLYSLGKKAFGSDEDPGLSPGLSPFDDAALTKMAGDSADADIIKDIDFGFADGGEVGGDYPLSDTYQSYLGQQRIYPFSGSGLYGNPLTATGVAGPYGSQLSEGGQRHLMTAEPPAAKKYSPADLAKKSLEALRDQVAAAQKKTAANDDRGGFAVGGTPYGDSGGYVPSPEDVEHYTLQTPGTSPGQAQSGSGLGALGDVASLAKTAMMFAALKTGGRATRKGYDAGGAPDDDDGGEDPYKNVTRITLPPQATAPVGDPTVDRPPGWDAHGEGPSIVNAPGLGGKFKGYPDPLAEEAYSKSADVDISPRAVAPPGGGLGKTIRDWVTGIRDNHTSEPAMPWHPPHVLDQEAGAPDQNVVSAPRGLNSGRAPSPMARPDQPWDNAGLGSVAAPSINPGAQDVSGLAGSTPNVPPPGSEPEKASGPGFIQRALETIRNAPDGEDWMQKNQGWLVPLVKGIGAATLYPGKSVIGALAYGAQNAAEGYEETQNQMQERQTAQAETSAINANAPFAHGYAHLADGSWMLEAQYRALAAQGKAPPLYQATTGNNLPYTQPQAAGHESMAGAAVHDARGQMVQPTGHLGEAGAQQAGHDFATLATMDPEQKQLAMHRSAELEQGMLSSFGTARQQGSVLNQTTDALLHLRPEGAAAPGVFAPLRMLAINRYNDVVRTVAPMVGADPQQFMSPEVQDDAGWAAAANKMSTFLKFAQTHGADQNSLGALEEASQMVPSTSLSRDQAIKVIAGLYVDKQRMIDEYNYLNEYKNRAGAASGMPGAYLADNARRAFSADHNDAEYGHAKEAIINFLSRTNQKAGSSAFSDLYSGKLSPQDIDKHYGFPISRYFLNN